MIKYEYLQKRAKKNRKNEGITYAELTHIE